MSIKYDAYEMDEKYLKESAFLLEKIKMRDKMKDLLKFTSHHRTAKVRTVIAKLDKVIEQTERIMEHHIKRVRLEKECERQAAQCLQMIERILP